MTFNFFLQKKIDFFYYFSQCLFLIVKKLPKFSLYSWVITFCFFADVSSICDPNCITEEITCISNDLQSL